MAEDVNQEDEPVKDEGADEGAGETAVEEKEEVVDEEGSAETADEESGEPASLDLILDIPLAVTVELGRSKMLINDLLQLGQGSVLSLIHI